MFARKPDPATAIPADALNAPSLPECHDDPAPPPYVPEALRADYRPDPAGEAVDWVEHGREAADAAHAEHRRRAGRPMPERLHINLVPQHYADVAASLVTDEHCAQRAHARRHDRAAHAVHAREQAAAVRTSTTCQVCGLILAITVCIDAMTHG